MRLMPNLKELFVSLSSLPSIEQASGDVVPLPGTNGIMAEHLFINLLRPMPDESDPEKVLTVFRADTQKVLRLVDEMTQPCIYASVVVSHYTVPKEGSNVRLYRTRVSATDLSRVKIQNYTDFCQGEESFYPPIMEFLSRS